MSATSTPSSASTKRACDSCHRRKVKCIGEGISPCKNCVSAGLTCTFNAVPQKKGPKGTRAKVLSELRETQRQCQLAPGGPGGSFGHDGGRSMSPSSLLTRTPGLVTANILEACMEFYFANLYPTQPILHHGRIQQSIMAMEHSVEAYCKMVSLCAYVLLQPSMVLPPSSRPIGEFGHVSNVSLGHCLLEETIRVRKGYEFSDNPSLDTVYTSFYIFSCYFCLDRQNAAWIYLRQASTLAHIIGLHDEETYKDDDMIDTCSKRKLFWVLFMTERAYAFKRHRPLTLHATIELPSVDEDPTEAVQLNGFINLIKLYKPFDETFFGLWNRTSHGAVPPWLIQLQRQLSDALPTFLQSTETQAVDLKMTQQWLKTMVWQLAISHGFISSMASDNTLSFRYPIDISRDLVEMTVEFSQHAMEVHGIGLVEKLFDVACTLIDVMACVPLSPSSYEMGPRDYLNRFVSLISSLRGGQPRYLNLLQSKISEVLPSYQLPLHSSLSAGRIDVFHPSASASNATSREESSFGSPPALGMRPNMPMHYPESIHPSAIGVAGSYPTFSTALSYQGSPTTTSHATQGLYQTHLPAQSGYQTQYGNAEKPQG